MVRLNDSREIFLVVGVLHVEAELTRLIYSYSKVQWKIIWLIKKYVIGLWYRNGVKFHNLLSQFLEKRSFFVNNADRTKYFDTGIERSKSILACFYEQVSRTRKG